MVVLRLLQPSLSKNLAYSSLGMSQILCLIIIQKFAYNNEKDYVYSLTIVRMEVLIFESWLGFWDLADFLIGCSNRWQPALLSTALHCFANLESDLSALISKSQQKYLFIFMVWSQRLVIWSQILRSFEQ